jgi:hypothetical protein
MRLNAAMKRRPKGRVTQRTLGVLSIAALLAAAVVGVRSSVAAPGGLGQASITLGNNDAKTCYEHENIWTLDKTAQSNIVDGVGNVSWTVAATKSSGATTFSVHGGLTITNTGSAPATIGNIVINLQKTNSPKKGGNASHVSIAADVADATSGDGATSAKIVASASQETQSTNVAWGTNNYTASGAQGIFIETPASGALEFTDASDNTLFSLVPQPVIPVGGSVTLLYHAGFNFIPAAGNQLRVEALVSFGNSGARGGSGSTATNIDINGSGGLTSDESNVRTVPSRVNLGIMPSAPNECNNSVTVSDAGPTTSGTVTTSNESDFAGLFPATISENATWNLGADVDSGVDGGAVCNEATLEGLTTGGTLNVIVGYHVGIVGYTPIVRDEFGNPISGGDPIYGQVPDYATFVCCEGADLSDSACVDVAPPSGTTTGFQSGDYCTAVPGEYQNEAQTPGQVYDNNYLSSFPLGLTLGVNDGAGANHHSWWASTTLGRKNLEDYLNGGGQSGPLTADEVNATSTDGGSLPKQVAALWLNVVFNDGGLLGGTLNSTTPFGDLVLDNYTGAAAAVNGKSIRQVLAEANLALGTGVLPSYAATWDDLNDLVTDLNQSFQNCNVHPLVKIQHHLRLP